MHISTDIAPCIGIVRECCAIMKEIYDKIKYIVASSSTRCLRRGGEPLQVYWIGESNLQADWRRRMGCLERVCMKKNCVHVVEKQQAWFKELGWASCVMCSLVRKHAAICPRKEVSTVCYDWAMGKCCVHAHEELCTLCSTCRSDRSCTAMQNAVGSTVESYR